MKITKKREQTMNRHFDQVHAFDDTYAIREINLETIITHNEDHQHKLFLEDRIKKIVSRECLPPTEYFTMADPYVSRLLVSPQNLSDILAIAGRFPGGLTDFLGFECHLNGEGSRADWALAISGKGKARYELVDFLNNGHLPKSYMKTSEWKHIRAFAQTWADPCSSLNDNVLGAWLEFDMPESSPLIPVPSVFFNPTNINGKTAVDPSQYEWFTKEALPLLSGHPLPKGIERRVYQCIQKMPTDASLFIVGVMLSRAISDVRMSVQFHNPNQIIPYLQAIGWSDDTGVFASIIEELETKKVNRLVLDYDVGKNIGHKIAIECSFYPNHYQRETHWKDFLDYLVEKNLVTPEKRDALLEFPGDEQNNTLVRYITHVKIVYEPNRPLKVKAYLAIRHFSQQEN